MIPTLVIVTGLPCSGKTSLAKQIASSLALPLITKDDIKERLFDSLGWKDREWSQKLGVATYALMYHILETFLAKKVPLAVESNFSPGRDDLKLLEILSRAPFYPIQLNCYADGKILIDRFLQRMGHRHPGHIDSDLATELENSLATGHLQPLNIGGTLIEVDTTDFNLVDLGKITRDIRIAIKSKINDS